MTNRNSPFQQASKSCISVILVGQVIPVDPERLEHLWFDSWVIGNIITEKFHLLWRALFICDHRGFTFHSSSNYHHYHHFIITLSSHHHHYHQIIITLSSRCHPQLVKITSLITSAGKDCISWKGSQTTERKGEKRWFKPNPWSDGFDSKYIWVRWDPLMINTAIMPLYLWKRWDVTSVTHNTPTIRK